MEDFYLNITNMLLYYLNYLLTEGNEKNDKSFPSNTKYIIWFEL